MDTTLCSETLYWLRLLQSSGLTCAQVESLMKEVDELIAIITKIIIKAEQNANHQ
ncbi:MAG: four helix bundle protein [Acidobacteriota bacterium]